MKTIIFYSSTYNGNTLKIAESMAAVLSADLVSIESETSGIDLSKYDLIGLGSAIHFAEHNIQLQRFVFHPLPSVHRWLSQSTERNSEATKG